MKKFENYCAALKNLEDIYRYHEPYENVILTGLVGLYDICFEQAWKAMKEVLEYNGVSEGKTGSQAGMIQEEEMWLEALQTRNNVAHAYNYDIAMAVGTAIDIVKKGKRMLPPVVL